ncbi:MAG: phosphatase PAP2 family protein [Ilyomonas sp.]
MKLLTVRFKSMFVVLTCFLFVQSSYAQNWDINIVKNANPDKPNSFVMKTFSKSVYPVSLASPVVLLATGYLQNNQQLKLKGWEAVGSLAINTIVTQGLKYTIDRQRPYEKYPGIIHPYQIETDASFPSGHTSTAFATATTLSLEFKKWYVVVPAYAWAAGVGYSRLYLGEHYATDVISGAVVGAGSAVLSHWLSRKLLKK